MEHSRLGLPKMIDENNEFLYLWIVWLLRSDGTYSVDKIYEAERWAKTRKTTLEKYRSTRGVHIQSARILIEVPKQ